MRTHSLISAAVLSLGLVLPAGPTLLAQDRSNDAIRRWPTSVESGQVSGGDRVLVDQGPLAQRRSPGGGGGGGGRDGGGVRGGGGPQGGGGRVAVPRGSGGSDGGPYVGGRPYGGGRPVVVRPGVGYGYYPRYYYPYSSFYYGGGYFDTFGYWGNGWGPGWGYAGAYNGWGGYPFGGGYGYRGGYDVGRLRLQVQPRDAEVFVDGYYAGQVDDFDGRLQSLTLETGGYSVEIRKSGWETLTFDVRVTPGRTTNYRGELIPIK